MQGELLNLQGTITYQVNYVKNGHWQVLGGRVRPMQFSSVESAETAKANIQSTQGVSEAMVVRLVKSYHSDLQDRNVYSMTEYTAYREKVT